MLKAIVFDLDGVLAKTEKFSFAAAKETLKEFGIILTEKPYRFIGMSDKNIFQTLAKENGITANPEDYVKKKDKRYMELAKGNTKPFGNVDKFLENISQTEIKLAIASSGTDEKVKFSLNELELSKYFDVRVTGSEVHHSKPHPEIYEIATKKLGFLPEECLAVEDALNGIESAHNANMQVLAVTTSFPKEKLSHAELIVDNFADIKIDELRQLFE